MSWLSEDLFSSLETSQSFPRELDRHDFGFGSTHERDEISEKPERKST